MSLKKISSNVFGVAALVALSAVASHAQVFNYDVDFDFASGVGPGNNNLLINNASGYTLTAIDGSGNNALANPTTINIANFDLFDTGATGFPPGGNGTRNFLDNIAMNLKITPVFPGPSTPGNITQQLQGNIAGSVTYFNGGVATNSVVTFTTPAPGSYIDYNFGDYGTYRVDNLQYVPFGPPTSSTKGSISARVSYIPAVPEPGEYAAMAMAGLSVCGLMLRARRRSKA